MRRKMKREGVKGKGIECELILRNPERKIQRMKSFKPSALVAIV